MDETLCLFALMLEGKLRVKVYFTSTVLTITVLFPKSTKTSLANVALFGGITSYCIKMHRSGLE